MRTSAPTAVTSSGKSGSIKIDRDSERGDKGRHRGSAHCRDGGARPFFFFDFRTRIGILSRGLFFAQTSPEQEMNATRKMEVLKLGRSRSLVGFVLFAGACTIMGLAETFH